MGRPGRAGSNARTLWVGCNGQMSLGGCREQQTMGSHPVLARLRRGRLKRGEDHIVAFDQ